MPTWSKVLGNRSIRGEKALGVAWRFEPLHAPLPLARGLMRVLRTVVEGAVLAMLYPGQHLALRRAVALELIRDQHPGDILTAFEERAEERLGGVLVAPPLHEDVEHHAVLIHRPPQIVPLLVDGDEYLIKLPFSPLKPKMIPVLRKVGNWL
jgi:hypothetical protein